LIPVQLINSEKNEENLVTLLFPRFKSEFLKRLFIGKNKSPYIKISLDKFGSAFWSHCDGIQDVHTIGVKLENEFGDSIAPVYERLRVFILQLRKNGFMDLKEKNI
jgi:hypothetical protein